MAIFKNSSEACKQKFPIIYQELFSRCSLVVSAPCSFWWTGEYGVVNGSLAIQQKLPMRVYVGLENVSQPGIKLGQSCFFIISKNKVEPWLDQDMVVNKIFDYIDPELAITKQKIGLKVHIITEAPPGCGMNTSGAFAATLATALNLKLGGLKTEEINSWQKAKAKDLIGDPTNQFNQTFRLAWKINSIFHADSSTGSTTFTPFIASSLPVLYFSEKRVGTFNNHQGCRFPLDLQGQYQIIDQIPYWGMSMEEFFQIDPPANYPISFGLIYSGDSRQTGAVIRSLRTIKERLTEVSLMMKEDFKTLVLPAELEEHSFLALSHERKHRVGQNLWETYIDTISVISLEILYYFKEILFSGMSENTLRDFFKAIDRNQDLLKTIDTSFPTIDYVCHHLHWLAREIDDEFGIGVKNTCAGKKGDVLFVCSDYSFRDSIESAILEMRQKTKLDIGLDYLSWVDGIEKEGVKIEQFLEDRLYSDFIAKQTIKLRQFSQQQEQEILWSLDKFEKNKSKIDLLIDPVNNEIYIQGKQMTSKELHSMVATINILRQLLENSSHIIGNEDLPSSSYSENRNEFQSKIISPLVKIVKKITAKSLKFKIIGGLVDFRIQLDLEDFEIFVLEKYY